MLFGMIFFPLFGFLLNGLAYAMDPSRMDKKISKQISGLIALLGIGGSFVCAIACVYQLQWTPNGFLSSTLFDWIHLESFVVPFSLRMDALNSLFALVITGIGTLIHLYSIGYMEHENGFAKYFAYLNLFCEMMLFLVLGSNMPMTFLGWEGVGLCSYLLIGFWFEDPLKAQAGKKAFVVNRIGDVGFLIAMFSIYHFFGTLDYAALSHQFHELTLSPFVLNGIVLCLFLGCTGKSAQIPLFVWLPDAMAGPTPVSALIHAATMVTSGVYLLSRLNGLVVQAPFAMEVIAGVGIVTALYGASVALVQTDIKKILAYSTVSQLGYMFLACGVGAFQAALFHVMTHAFFKALLFLGSGSVIHAMHHEQNILKMGQLKKAMPMTALTFGLGVAAIMGIAPFSGFFSKDEILWHTFLSGHYLHYALGLLTAGLTAFYMVRCYVLTFLSTSRVEHVHPHESQWQMLLPLQILAALSVFGGLLGVPHWSFLEHYLSAVIPSHHGIEGSAWVEGFLMFLSLSVAVGAGFWGYLQYRHYGESKTKVVWKGNPLYALLLNKGYVDEAYDFGIVSPLFKGFQALWKWIDQGLIDALIVGLGRVFILISEIFRLLQNGSLHVYAFMFLTGFVILMGYFVYGI